MSVERWGSLSVADHVDANALAINVLLYDRLVVPIMAEQPDRNERWYWEQKGWKPELQAARVRQLGNLAIELPWDVSLRERFSSRFARLNAEQYDAERLAQRTTRMILAEAPVKHPKGVTSVRVVAAYSSTDAIEEDFQLADATSHREAQACLIGHRLEFPGHRRADDNLSAAIELSRDKGFQKVRRALFDWTEVQRTVGRSAQEIVDEISELTHEFNQAVRKAKRVRNARLVFTVAGVGLLFAAGGPLAVTAAGAALSAIQFATLDAKPAIDAGTAAPVAMFHDLKQRVGARLGTRS